MRYDNFLLRSQLVRSYQNFSNISILKSLISVTHLKIYNNVIKHLLMIYKIESAKKHTLQGLKWLVQMHNNKAKNM